MMFNLMDWGLGFVVGASFTSLVWLKLSTPSRQLNLVEENVALTLLANEAIDRLDEHERHELQQDVADAMDDALGEDATVEIDTEVGDE